MFLVLVLSHLGHASPEEREDQPEKGVEGIWVGNVHEPRASVPRYSMTLRLIRSKEGSIRGTSNYHELDCTGELLEQSGSAAVVTLRERVTSGCKSGYVRVEILNTNTMAWTWANRRNGSADATATLTRANGDSQSTAQLTQADSEHIAGTWSGSVFEPGARVSRYSLALNLVSRNGQVVSGTSDYGELRCTGKLVTRENKSESLVLREQVTRGCANGYVNILLQTDGTLLWTWARRKGGRTEATATLTRAESDTAEDDFLDGTSGEPQFADSCRPHQSRGPASNSQRVRVIQVLRDTRVAGDGVDALFERWLSQETTVRGVVLWDAFGILMTMQDALAKAQEGNIEGASGVVARAISAQVVPKSALASTLDSTASIARLAGLPIEWTLRTFAIEAGKDAINNQITLYFAARDAQWTHQRILSGASEFPVVFSDSGYILQVDALRPVVRIPFAQLMPRNELYDFARLLYESDDTSKAVDRAIASLIADFEACLSNSTTGAQSRTGR